MSSVSSEFKQDLPPPGGYKPFNYGRVPAKSYFSGYGIIAGFFVVSTSSLYLYYLNYESVKRRELEMRSATFAIRPMLLAERDRQQLKYLRKQRDEEADLMKNVEGWKVGTYYGEPIYKSISKDQYLEPRLEDVYGHSSYKDYFRRAAWMQYT